MENRRRVVVTGMGLRSPIGNTLDAFVESMQRGTSGVRQMPEWDRIASLRTKLAGVCTDVDGKSIPRKYRRTMGRVAILAALGMQDAVADANLDEEIVAGDRCGVSFGSTSGSSTTQEKYLKGIWDKSSVRGVASSPYLQFMSHTCAANLSTLFHTRGPLAASCTACVAGSQGVGSGVEQIRLGNAEVMLCGGAEEMHYMVAVVFDVMRAASSRYNAAPEETPRPFDEERDGLVVGEGAGCLVLEEWEHARRRGARIYAEILGYGTNTDGQQMTTPDPDSMAAVLVRALEDARLSADKIEYVNAHATATVVGDLAESIALHRVLGDQVPVSGLKGYMGHTLGASGAIESIATILMMKERFIAPTRNLVKPDPKCAPLNHVVHDPRECALSVGMNNNFAFGGVNTSLIFGTV